MSLTLLTGPVRSGKSELAARLAAETGRAVTVAVAGAADDDEMRLRIDRHRRARPADWSTLELTARDLTGPGGPAAWIAAVPDDQTLVVDCLGTLLAGVLAGLGPFDDVVIPDTQRRVEEAARAVTSALIARTGPTIIVSNEVGWGVVPSYASARVFRDVAGRANRDLASAADRALLVVAGRVLDLATLPSIEEMP